MKEQKYKIIGTSNFDNERVDDILVCENISSELTGKIILEAVKRQYESNSSRYYYKLVPQEHTLYTWEP